MFLCTFISRYFPWYERWCSCGQLSDGRKWANLLANLENKDIFGKSANRRIICIFLHNYLISILAVIWLGKGTLFFRC